MKEKNVSPLDERPFRHKKKSLDFHCPLCRTERSFVGSYKLKKIHYIQIIFLGSVTSALFWPIMGVRSFFVFFVYWTFFELGVRLFYRVEIPCPYCGFDASWYKKDIKVAKKIIDEFWEKEPTEETKKEDIPDAS